MTRQQQCQLNELVVFELEAFTAYEIEIFEEKLKDSIDNHVNINRKKSR